MSPGVVLVPEALAMLAGELHGVVIADGAPIKDRRQQAAKYFDALWDGIEGVAAFAAGYDGYYNETGKYAFGRFEQIFHRWPEQRMQIVDAVLRLSDSADVYACPMLRTRPDRRKGSGLGSRWLWVDVDDPSTAWREQIERYWSPGSFVVGSGRGVHCYIRLESLQPTDVVERLNARLAAAVGGDHKWDETALMRVPGTYWQKGRALGQASRLVWMEDSK